MSEVNVLEGCGFILAMPAKGDEGGTQYMAGEIDRAITPDSYLVDLFDWKAERTGAVSRILAIGDLAQADIYCDSAEYYNALGKLQDQLTGQDEPPVIETPAGMQ